MFIFKKHALFNNIVILLLLTFILNVFSYTDQDIELLRSPDEHKQNNFTDEDIFDISDVSDTSDVSNKLDTSDIKDKSETETDPAVAISANPAAVSAIIGTGDLGRLVNIQPEEGVRLGGLWIANGNAVANRNDGAPVWTGNNLVIIDLNIDTEKLSLWRGGEFGIEFLQFNGQNTNSTSGAVQEFNGISANPPFARTELYQAWFRQLLFNEKLTIRIGKLLPSYDFNNVLRPVPSRTKAYQIPSVSGLLYTPIYVNSSLLGVLPSYYDNAFGIVTNFTPIKHFYASIGAYDGNAARGIHTGLTGPHFNGYYFYIGEMGFNWVLNKHNPGIFAVGTWYQTGLLSAGGVTQKGTDGIYTFGSQRLWSRHPGEDNSGIGGFFQYGINNSKTMIMRQYLGGGFTAFGLTRDVDSFGVGAALAWVNKNLFPRGHDLIFQGYYQAYLFKNTYLEPAISYIPIPGATTDLSSNWAFTLQSTMLF